MDGGDLVYSLPFITAVVYALCVSILFQCLIAELRLCTLHSSALVCSFQSVAGMDLHLYCRFFKEGLELFLCQRYHVGDKAFKKSHWAKVPSKELSDALVEAFKDKLPD